MGLEKTIQDSQFKKTEPDAPSIWSVYLVRNRLNTLYCGISTDVARRFKEHQQGAPKGAKALRGKGPLTLMWQQEIGNRSQASQVEAKIKKLTRPQKELLIKGKLQAFDL